MATGAGAALVTANDTLTVTLGATGGASETTHTITMDGVNVKTVGDLINQLNTITGVSASLNSNGKLSIAATGGRS